MSQRWKRYAGLAATVICVAMSTFQPSRYARADDIDLANYPVLDTKELGHLQHIYRLANQLPGEWAFMGAREPDQEGDDGYRYQLAFMSYVLALTQYHYLPNYRELNQQASGRLI